RVQKTSKEGARQPLVGAIYALYRVNETGDNDIFIGQSTSDENGYMVFSDIQPGFWYYFREVFAPDGHTVDPYPTTPFLVNADGTLTYENELPTTATEGEAEGMSYSRTLQDIQVAFLRTMSTSSFLQGASENKSDDGVQLLSATVNTLGGTTTLDGFFPSENAMPNTEVKLLETITVDGVSDYQTRISVGKIDTDTKEYVAGATMQILTTDGRLVHEWTTGSDATSVVGLLNVNTYYIIREAKAPNGYTTAADTRVYLDAYGNLITVDGADSSYAGGTMVNIYDTKLATLRYNYIIRRGASTDDASAYSLQISLIAMVISALVLAVLLVLKIKTRPSTKRADNE
ncbi:MAG: hypothetical protein GX683_01660, partial [Ruminococcaceae bacterium]|nr:hypothetical protein [Oscillospiraceae bacterium]